MLDAEWGSVRVVFLSAEVGMLVLAVLLAQATPSHPPAKGTTVPPNVRCVADSFGNYTCSDGSRIVRDSFGNFTMVPGRK